MNNTYEEKICKYCIYKNMCNKDKFVTFQREDKISIRCPQYKYERFKT